MDPIQHCDQLVGEERACSLAFLWFFTVCLGWFALPLGVIGRLYSGPSCSKLTMSLVNLRRVIRKYAEFFCWKNVSSFCTAKAAHIFSAKNIRILYIESTKTVNKMTLNKLVKLTTLWKTGPCTVHSNFSGWNTKTYLYNFDPLKPHFYIVKLGFTGVHYC